MRTARWCRRISPDHAPSRSSIPRAAPPRRRACWPQASPSVPFAAAEWWPGTTTRLAAPWGSVALAPPTATPPVSCWPTSSASRTSTNHGSATSVRSFAPRATRTSTSSPPTSGPTSPARSMPRTSPRSTRCCNVSIASSWWTRATTCGPRTGWPLRDRRPAGGHEHRPGGHRLQRAVDARRAPGRRLRQPAAEDDHRSLRTEPQGRHQLAADLVQVTKETRGGAPGAVRPRPGVRFGGALRTAVGRRDPLVAARCAAMAEDDCAATVPGGCRPDVGPSARGFADRDDDPLG